jgi:hypothetical protein
MIGPNKGGRLNEANIVMQSRSVKSAYEGKGTGRGGPPGPKSRAKAWSLKRQRPIFAVDEAANFAVPLVTRVAGLFCTVEVRVSRVLAVRYVPPYSIHIRPKGLEKIRLWGRRRKVVREAFKEFLRVAWPEAFCIIALQIHLSSDSGNETGGRTNLSITVMSGATRLAAHAPDTKSDASRKPRFFVFHTLGSIRGVPATFDTGDIGFGAGWVSIPRAGLSSPGGRVIVRSLTLYPLNSLKIWSERPRGACRLCKGSADQLVSCISSTGRHWPIRSRFQSGVFFRLLIEKSDKTSPHVIRPACLRARKCRVPCRNKTVKMMEARRRKIYPDFKDFKTSDPWPDPRWRGVALRPPLRSGHNLLSCPR